MKVTKLINRTRKFIAICIMSTGCILSSAHAQNSNSETSVQQTTININKATAAELKALPGIGTSKATAIIQYRTKHGAFKKIHELMRVKGFGRKLFRRLKKYIKA